MVPPCQDLVNLTRVSSKQIVLRVWFLRAALIATIGSSCGEQRFELISAPADSGSDGDGGEVVACEPATFDLGKVYAKVTLTQGARGPIGFGVRPDGVLESFVVRDGGVVFSVVAQSASLSTFSATNGPEGVAVAFHAPAPSLQLVDDEGVARGAPRPVLPVMEGPNPGWGLRVTADATRYLVVWRTLGARSAFSTVSATQVDSAMKGFVGLLEIDGVLVGDAVRLLVESNAEVVEWEGTLDGGALAQRTIASTPLAGRPFVCPSVSLYPRRTSDGGTGIEGVAPGGAAFVVRESASRLVRGVCEPSSMLAMTAETSTLAVSRVFPDGQVKPVVTFPIPALDDAMISTDGVSVWLVTAPHNQPATMRPAVLSRQCLPRPLIDDAGTVGGGSGGGAASPREFTSGCSVGPPTLFLAAAALVGLWRRRSQ